MGLKKLLNTKFPVRHRVTFSDGNKLCVGVGSTKKKATSRAKKDCKKEGVNTKKKLFKTSDKGRFGQFRKKKKR